MPYVLDDTEVNMPVFGDMDLSGQSPPADYSKTVAAELSQGRFHRKARRLMIGYRLWNTEFRLRLLRDPVIRSRIAEIVQEAHQSRLKASHSQQTSAHGKKYKTIFVAGSSGMERNDEGKLRKSLAKGRSHK